MKRPSYIFPNDVINHIGLLVVPAIYVLRVCLYVNLRVMQRQRALLRLVKVAINFTFAKCEFMP